MNSVAQPASLCPTSQEQTTFLSASMATQVHTSPQIRFSTIGGVTFFCLAPTKDQISSTWTRLQERFTRVLFMYSEQAAPSSTSSFAIVFLATPVMRTVARIELPSTSAATT